jgi:hypothetical protein
MVNRKEHERKKGKKERKRGYELYSHKIITG